MRFAAQAVVCIGNAGINALATIRSLGRRGVRVHAVSLEGSAEIASLSRYCASRSRVGSTAALFEALCRLAEALGARVRKPLLYIDNDAMMTALAPHAAALEARFAVVEPLADAPRLTDKRFQLEVARAAGIAVPRTWYPDSWEALRSIGAEHALIAKPAPAPMQGGTPPAFKAVVARSAEQLAGRLQALVRTPAGILVQQFIEGDDSQIYAALCYRARSLERSFVLSVRKLRQTEPGAGVMAVGQAVDAPQVREMSAALAARLGVHGVLSTEFKLDRRDGKYYFIEWNPRPAYFQSIGWKAGFDLAWLAYCDLVCPEQLEQLAKPRQPAVPLGHYWINLHGDLAHLRRVPGLARRLATWKPYIRGAEWAVFAPDDPRPWLKAMSRLGAWLGQGLSRRRVARASDGAAPAHAPSCSRAAPARGRLRS